MKLFSFQNQKLSTMAGMPILRLFSSIAGPNRLGKERTIPTVSICPHGGFLDQTLIGIIDPEREEMNSLTFFQTVDVIDDEKQDDGNDKNKRNNLNTRVLMRCSFHCPIGRIRNQCHRR
jgi:hypothetical protein